MKITWKMLLSLKLNILFLIMSNWIKNEIIFNFFNSKGSGSVKKVTRNRNTAPPWPLGSREFFSNFSHYSPPDTSPTPQFYRILASQSWPFRWWSWTSSLSGTAIQLEWSQWIWDLIILPGSKSCSLSESYHLVLKFSNMLSKNQGLYIYKWIYIILNSTYNLKFFTKRISNKYIFM